MQLNYRQSRGGFTLIEMMIALVITMMMVFAMVEAFQWIGEATTTGRAQIEMAGQLRAARYRLELDLNGVTVPMRPWVDSQAHPGYFELIEGTASDTNPSQFVSPAAIGYQTINFANPNDNLALQSRSLFGDLDDILMFTARNDQEPFRGRYVTLDGAGNPQTIMIESNLAEIIWWAELNDTKPDNAPNGQWDPGETFTIRRRVLLIRPDLVDPTTGVTSLPLYTTNTDEPAGNNHVIQLNDPLVIAKFLDENDISIRPVYDNAYNVVGFAPNTLADLSLRHNRVAHWWLSSVRDGGSNPQFIGMSNTALGHMLSPIKIDQDYFPSFRKNMPGYANPLSHFGEDVMLTNVTAFDFRVWDANVPVVQDAGGLNEALGPGDPGYAAQIATGLPAIVGQGTYIDLGALAGDNATLNLLAANTTTLLNPNTGKPFLNNTTFAGFPNYKSYLYPYTGTPPAISMTYNASYPFVYDPWTITYEKDGFNQDEDLDANGNSLVDEGTDGLDTIDTSLATPNIVSGPDDVNERETSPPYAVPLKSIRVSIRMYEPDTRQIRQTTHEMNFSE